MMKIIELDGSIVQQFLYNFAGFFIIPDESKAFPLCISIMSLFQNEQVKEIIKEKYGEKYPLVEKALNQYFTIINDLNIYLNQARNETTNEEYKKIYFNKALELNKKLPLIYPPLFQILNIILTNTNLNAQSVPREAMAIYTKEYKQVKYTTPDQKRTLNADPFQKIPQRG